MLCNAKVTLLVTPNVCSKCIKASQPAEFPTFATATTMSYLEEKPHIGSHANSKAHHYALLKSSHKQGKKNDVFCKTIVNPEVLTKKQRAKLIQGSNDKSNFAFDVYYSLNRKYRWQQIGGADDLIAMDAHVLPQQIQLEGTNIATSLGKKRLVQTHFEREIDGSVVETTNHEPALGTFNRVVAKKHKQKVIKGMALALRDFGKDEKREAENVVAPVVRYVATKPHPSAQVYGSGILRGSCNVAADSGKWDDIDDNGDYFSDEYEYDYDDDTDSATDEEAAIYSAPKQKTFSLSDFVIEKQKPVMSVKSETSIDFVDDCEDFIDDFKSSKPTDKNVYSDELRLPSDLFFREVDLKWKKSTKKSTFASEFETLSSVPEHTFRWLNADKTSCIVDLTKRLDSSAKNETLLVVFEKIVCHTNMIRILISGSFPCPTDLSLRVLRRLEFKSPTEFIDRIVLRSQKTYDKNHEYAKRVGDITEYQGVYYPDQFTHSSRADRAAVLKCPSITDITSDVIDFEFITDDSTDAVIAPETCHICGTDDILTFSVFDGCNHTFCRNCVRSRFTTDVANRSEFPLKCFDTNCMAPVRPEMLYVVLPLPAIKFYFRSAFKAEATACGDKTVRCPGCRNFLSIKIETEFGSIACVNCNVSFCLKCFKRPHFPLNCLELEQWNEKFTRQCVLTDLPPKNITKCQCGTLNFIPKKYTWKHACVGCGKIYYYEGNYGFRTFPGRITLEVFEHPKVIASQYFEVCAPLFQMRFRASTAFDFKKYCLPVVESSQKESVVTARKLALHMLELGFAWLYLNRGSDTTIWTDAKVKLTQLHAKMEEINVIVDQRVVLNSTAEKVLQLNDIVKCVMCTFTNSV
uniref:Elf4 domain-containing protein n=2 Tax=Panagrellus redivivus TaxID=6233 RepID=A0A7E4VL79_PANRE